MRKILLTDEQKQYIKDNYDKQTFADICKHLKMSDKPVLRAIKEMGLGDKPIVQYSVWTKEIQEVVIAKYATTDTQDLANEIGIAPHNIRTWARKHGLKKQKGYIHHNVQNAKLTKEQKVWLYNNYSKYSNEYIVNYLGADWSNIVSYGNSKGLKKDPMLVSGAMNSRESFMLKRQNDEYNVNDFLGNQPEPKLDASCLFKAKAGKYHVNDHYFEVIDNEWKAYWLGFLYADGCNDITNWCIRLKIQDRDKQHVEAFRDSLQSDCNIKTIPPKITKIKDRVTYGGAQCEVNICNQQLCLQLEKLGCVQNKTYILQFPTFEQVPKTLMRHFIRGFLDGDGWISYSKNYETPYLGFVGMEQFLVKLRDFIVDECGVRCVAIRDRKNRETAAKEIAWSSFLDCEKIYNYLYSHCNIYLKRKLKKFDEVFCLGQFKYE